MIFNKNDLPIDGAASFSGTSLQPNLALSSSVMVFPGVSDIAAAGTKNTEGYDSVLFSQPIAFNLSTFRLPLNPYSRPARSNLDLGKKTCSFDETGMTESEKALTFSISSSGTPLKNVSTTGHILDILNMYKAFYNLSEMPFQISSDPRFLWLGAEHNEALAF